MGSRHVDPQLQRPSSSRQSTSLSESCEAVHWHIDRRPQADGSDSVQQSCLLSIAHRQRAAQQPSAQHYRYCRSQSFRRE